MPPTKHDNSEARRPLPPLHFIMPNQKESLDANEGASDASRASLIGPRLMPVNPRELMWAHQIRREHKHLLAHFEELAASVTAVEQQQADTVGEFCTIENLEKVRTNDKLERRDEIQALQRKLEAIEETNKLTTERFEAFWDNCLTNLVRPLVERTALLEQNLEEACKKLENTKQSLFEAHSREQTAAAKSPTPRELQKMVEKAMQRGPLFAQDYPDHHHKDNLEIEDPTSVGGPVSKQIVAAKVTNKRNKMNSPLDSSSKIRRQWRDSAISMQYDVGSLQEVDLPDLEQHAEASFSQATTSQNESLTLLPHRPKSLASCRSLSPELISVKQAEHKTHDPLKRSTCISSPHSVRTTPSRHQLQDRVASTPFRSPPTLPPLNRRRTIQITDTIPSARSFLSPFYSVNSASSSRENSSTLEIRACDSQLARTATQQESDRREEPTSPSPNVSTSRAARPYRKIPATPAQCRLQEKRKQASQRHGLAKPAFKATQPAASTKRRRTIPSTVDELQAEMQRASK